MGVIFEISDPVSGLPRYVTKTVWECAARKAEKEEYLEDLKLVKRLLSRYYNMRDLHDSRAPFQLLALKAAEDELKQKWGRYRRELLGGDELVELVAPTQKQEQKEETE